MKDCVNSICLNFTNKEDYNNFNIILEEKLKNLNILNYKKILICSIELIQNNFIHNNNNKLKLTIYRSSNNIFIETEQYFTQEIANKIINKISKINSKTMSELKEMYQKNVITPNLSQSVGNGFITCKLKSKNNIETQIAKENNQKMIIKLKFEI